MFCKYCGGELVQEVRSCTFCGKELIAATEVSKSEEALPTQTAAEPIQKTTAIASPSASSKSKGRYLLFGIGGTGLGAILLAVILFATGVLSLGNSTKKGNEITKAGGTKVEGTGYDTPEEAAEAYLEALKNQDLDAMVATFAVESYVDNFDYEAYLNRLQAYSPGYRFSFSYPNNSEYIRQMNIATRVSLITQIIDLQYTVFNLPEVMTQGITIPLSDEEEVKNFIAEYEKATDNYVFEELKITGTLAPEEFLEAYAEDLVESYASDRYKEIVDNRASVLGLYGEDVANVVITFEANGQDWIFCPQLVKYEDKWYMESFVGNLGSLLGLNQYTGGIFPDEF